jgi:diaminopimelate epimerase
MARHLQKWHGAGNDFLVDVQLGLEIHWTSELAAAVCNRTHGVGADGLLVATVGDVVQMVLFNGDGSLAEMSGNGIRCLAAAVRRATNGSWSSLVVSTTAGERVVTLEMNGDDGVGSVAMGEVRLLEALPGTLGVANVGNPHVVVLDQPDMSMTEREEIANKLSDAVGGANVEFVAVLNEKELSIRVLERGAGWTQACGTGSCATAAVTRAAGLTGNEVTVQNPGGPLRVSLDGALATLTGPVQFVADVEWRGA